MGNLFCAVQDDYGSRSGSDSGPSCVAALKKYSFFAAVLGVKVLVYHILSYDIRPCCPPARRVYRNRDIVLYRHKDLTKAATIVLQPHSSEFLKMSNHQAVMETELRHYSAITRGKINSLFLVSDVPSVDNGCALLSACAAPAPGPVQSLLDTVLMPVCSSPMREIPCFDMVVVLSSECSLLEALSPVARQQQNLDVPTFTSHPGSQRAPPSMPTALTIHASTSLYRLVYHRHVTLVAFCLLLTHGVGFAAEWNEWVIATGTTVAFRYRKTLYKFNVLECIDTDGKSQETVCVQVRRCWTTRRLVGQHKAAEAREGDGCTRCFAGSVCLGFLRDDNRAWLVVVVLLEGLESSFLCLISTIC